MLRDTGSIGTGYAVALVVLPCTENDWYVVVFQLKLRLRFNSCSTCPHSLPLSPWYDVTAYVARRPLEVPRASERGHVEQLLKRSLKLVVTSPTSSFSSGTTILFIFMIHLI